jgi:hypothetical protein
LYRITFDMQMDINIKDSYIHKGQRAKLVEQLRDKGIKDERILNAIGKIPRHLLLKKLSNKELMMIMPFLFLQVRQFRNHIL